MRARGEHSILDIHEKARLALSDKRTIRIAMKADSPTSGENIAKRQKFGRAKRVSTAALVRLRKKFEKEFWTLPEIVSVFLCLSEFEQKEFLAELPENICMALRAKRGLK